MRRSPLKIHQTAAQAAQTAPVWPKAPSSGNVGEAEGVLQTFLNCCRSRVVNGGVTPATVAEQK